MFSSDSFRLISEGLEYGPTEASSPAILVVEFRYVELRTSRKIGLRRESVAGRVTYRFLAFSSGLGVCRENVVVVSMVREVSDNSIDISFNPSACLVLRSSLSLYNISFASAPTALAASLYAPYQHLCTYRS